MSGPSAAVGQYYENSGTIFCNASHSSKIENWILDTGVTNHICHSLSKFHSYKRIEPVFVKLPNGSNILTQHSGTVYFSENLFLNNVLYIPSFNFNLISVSQLINSLNCKLTFLDTSCHIQDSHSLRTIGATDLHKGLYLLRDSSSKNISFYHVVNNFCSFKPGVWHLRFSHASHEKLSCLQKLYPFIKLNKVESIPCDVCHISKQKKLN